MTIDGLITVRSSFGHGETLARFEAAGTVKSHAKHIFWKLTVQTRGQAVYRASELGLI